ncbi:hypothetical protein SAMN05892883_0415 [Jatrophihabitans sp. GAS493]|uniref:nitrate ABC transporter substrate-binding protein n=1 Tax=Jatrophihabitans sp. GAS493 TaxID=1907575 RepID=UPI000BB8789A|nr:nitrate ABC transporter substrate-binding protein [Jatrophihabitans sp. GAS493]SOD70773.1 hypothetical protein SAMN05892883_0415 [Jatrophihabitans sp. GAS493]
MPTRRKLIATAGAVTIAATALTACSSAATSAAVGNSSAAAGTLASVCPKTVVIQTDWYATPERAAAYQLAGPGGTVDAKKGAYLGKIGDTGVSVEVRLGGPFIGYQAVSAQMYTDTSITLGYVSTDSAVRDFAKFPTLGVVAPLDKDPQIVMWDPATLTTVKTWADVAPTNAKVLYTEGLTYMDYLVSKGIVKKSQLDASFDGSPSRFVAAGGKEMQQGYVSNEPYRWEHNVPQWNKPVKYLLVADAGWDVYPQQVAIRSAEKEKLSPCLKQLVPLLQKAQLDYIKDPAATNQTLLDIGAKIKDGPPITADGNADSVKVQLSEKIVANGTDGTLGSMDPTRLTNSISMLGTMFATKNIKIQDGLKPSDIATNEYLDPSIHQ